MGQNALFNPTKKDYELTQGATSTTDRIQEKAYFALMIPKGAWLYGEAEQGSDLHKFKGTKCAASVEQLFSARVKETIEKQLIATGQAKIVTITNTEATRTGTANDITIEEAATELAVQLKFNPVG